MLEEYVNLIEDDNFLNKDVSELVEGDYYLFHIKDWKDSCWIYYYKDGVVLVGAYSTSDDCIIVDKFEYTSGSLQELVEKLDEH